MRATSNNCDGMLWTKCRSCRCPRQAAITRGGCWDKIAHTRWTFCFYNFTRLNSRRTLLPRIKYETRCHSIAATFWDCRVLPHHFIMSSKNVGDSEEITGQSALPSTRYQWYEFLTRLDWANHVSVSRIKKIIQLDEDIVQCSNNATFVIAMATVCPINHPFKQSFRACLLTSTLGDVHSISCRARAQCGQVREETPKDGSIQRSWWVLCTMV